MRKILILALSVISVFVLGLCATSCNPANDPDKITLTFETDGGEAIKPMVVEKGAEVTLPDANRSGFDFMGWHLQSDLSDAAVKGVVTAPEVDTVYYAEWAESGSTFQLTLDLDGGTLPNAALSIRLRAGDNIYNKIQNLVPTKSGLTFGAWFFNGEELKSAHVMPENDVTLVAKYKVGYTIETYRSNVSGTAYVKDADVVTGSDYVDATVTPDAPTVENFTVTATPSGGNEPVTTLKLSQKASDNVFRFYYNRNIYRVNFDPNLPANIVTGIMGSSEVVFGGYYSLPVNAFEAVGYRFAGWNTDKSDNVAYDAESGVIIEGPTTFYAVWDRGYIDRFGSDDFIFFPRNEENVAILVRGGHEFRGVRVGEDSFEFEMPSGKMQGKIFGNLFSFERENIQGTYKFFDTNYNPENANGGIDESRTLVIESYLEATYTYENASYKGSISYDPEFGDYVFTSADRGLEPFHFLMGQFQNENVFEIASLKEQNVYIEMMLVAGDPYVVAQYNVVLDGYGNIILYASLGGSGFQFTGTYYIANEIFDRATNETMFKIVAEVDDAIGLLTPDAEPGVVEQVFYTMPFMAEQGKFYGYIAADTYAGAYRNGTQSLVLDGLKIFDDSAIYTDDQGVEHKGIYTVSRSYMNGNLVTLTTDDDKEIKLYVYVSDGTFKLFDEVETKEVTEYSLMTSRFDFPLLTLYDDFTDGRQRAELYMSDDGGDTLLIASKGYVTTERIGLDTDYYTYTVEENIDNGRPGVIPKQSMKFYMTEAISSEDRAVHNVYVVMEFDNEKRYTEYILDDGGKIWGNPNVTVSGLGSLYFTSTDDMLDWVYEGSFTVSNDTDFNFDYFTFIYGDGMNTYSLVYEIKMDDDQVWQATRRPKEKMTLYTLYYYEAERQQFYAPNLIIDGNGKAKYCYIENYAEEYFGDGEFLWQDATYVENPRATRFGFDTYTLYIGSEKIFDFAIYVTVSANGQTEPIYFQYSADAEGEYTAATGEKLELDGYYYCKYTDKNGTVSEGLFDLSENLVYLTLSDGYNTYVRLDPETNSFVTLDSAYGTYYLIDINYNAIGESNVSYTTIYFDGQGNVIVTTPSGARRTGFYTVIDEAKGQYNVNAIFADNLTMPQGGWKVQLITGGLESGCIIFDEGTYGSYYNDEWDVINIDGFGGGSLYKADGSMSGEGVYSVADEERGFMVFTFAETAEDNFIVFDFDNNTFKILDYDDYNMVYVSQDLDYISFNSAAEIRVGTTWAGQFFYDEKNIYAYLTNYEVNEETQQVETKVEVMPLPTGNTYTFNNKTYYKVTEALKINGKVEFQDQQGEIMSEQTKDISIEFSMRAGANVNLPAVVTIDDKGYDFVLNIYTQGACNPRITYSGVDYDIDFTFTGQATASSFVVHAGYREVNMNNYGDGLRDSATGAPLGGKIVKEVIGFGPLTISEATYSGEFGYHNNYGFVNDHKIIFKDFAEKDVVKLGYRQGGLGILYEIVFKNEGEGDDDTYAIDFYETSSTDQGPVYVLQGFYKYQEIEKNEYKIGVKYLVYANFANTPGYLDQTAVGKPFAATVYKNGKVVYLYDTNVTLNYDGVWINELINVGEDGTLEQIRSENIGKGYLISFVFDEEDKNKVTDATVNEYKIGQVVVAGYLINFLTKDDGSIATITSVAYAYEGAYYWLSDTKDLKDNGENTWTLTGTPYNGIETHYTFTFEITSEEKDGVTTYRYSVIIDAQ